VIVNKRPARPNRLPTTDAGDVPARQYSRLRELEERFVASLGEMRHRWRAPADLHERVRRALEAERQRSRLR
jgi:hypothetical protein